MNGRDPERQALLPPPNTRQDTDVQHQAVDSVLARQELRPRDPPLWGLGAISLLVTVGYTWYTVFVHADVTKLGWFALHPPLQTAAVLAFALGVMTLQPTLSAASKEAGRARHQKFQLGLGFPLILMGSISVIVHKEKMGWPHFTSLHSKVGLVTLILLVLQAVAGAASLWGKGVAVGGEDRGKSLWKWHRLLGYMILPMLLVTVLLGGTTTYWAKMNTNLAGRIVAYYVAPAYALIALWGRVRIHKMPQLGFT
ncbi:hypothetical protein RSOLAG1IB_01157 [Rhizoctonia solani AG-1 IB]|uniref:Cytochrome b561 domain-containing protein n=3 Tax=Rhizoctonia solani TaxID=456999 RepID=A0A8H2WM03_9AGAM|nr:unnamed protein product [Rhizoctonia solani]CEL55149.1 hypothetical protein RSOLAG1IB_01157 [Rhizoctonia solani AG-1 IB]